MNLKSFNFNTHLLCQIEKNTKAWMIEKSTVFKDLFPILKMLPTVKNSFNKIFLTNRHLNGNRRLSQDGALGTF